MPDSISREMKDTKRRLGAVAANNNIQNREGTNTRKFHLFSSMDVGNTIGTTLKIKKIQKIFAGSCRNLCGRAVASSQDPESTINFYSNFIERIRVPFGQH
jgi:hypothetical protein